MHVGMKDQRSCPRVKHPQRTDKPAKPTRVSSQLAQGAPGFGKQQTVKQLLIRSDERAELPGHREGHQKVANIEQTSAFPGQPFARLIVPALRAMSVHARVVLVNTLIVIRTGVDMTAERFGAATHDRIDSTHMAGRNLVPVAGQVSCTVRS